MIMHIGNEYYLAWAIYLASVVSAHILLWRVLRIFSNKDFATVCHLLLASILLTPAVLESGQNYWVPAFMMALMEGLNEGLQAAMPNLWSIGVVMLVLVSLSLGFKVFRSRQQAKPLETQSAAAD